MIAAVGVPERLPNIENVTFGTLQHHVERYCESRGGESNEDTESEAAFFLIAKYAGAFILSTGFGPMWVGLQNSSARWSHNGGAFPSIEHALEAAMWGRVGSGHTLVFYSEDSVSRLRFIADLVQANKEQKSLFAAARERINNASS